MLLSGARDCVSDLNLHFLPFLALLGLPFDLIDPLWLQMRMSAKKHIDGIEGALPLFVVVAVVASHVVEPNQRACGFFQVTVILNEPTIQPNQPWVTA